MKIVCTDVDIPRIDERNEPLHLTVGKEYDVIATEGYFYRIKNDLGKSARYMKIRFKEAKVFSLAEVEAIAKSAYVEALEDASFPTEDAPSYNDMWHNSITKNQTLCIDNGQFKKVQ